MLLKGLKLITSLVNYFHDWLIALTTSFGLHLTDKQLHFIVVGIFGIVFFGIVNQVFRWLAPRSITAISFIYTFTVLVVIVFAIEIEQRVTHKGNMEFQDIVQGLWGFIVSFLIYLVIKGLLYGVKRLHSKLKH